MTDLPETLAAFRAEIPSLPSGPYLASCSQGPLSNPVRRAIDGFLKGWERRGPNWDAWMEEVEAARAAFAGLIGASPRDVAIGTSVSQLVSSVVSALVRPDAAVEDGGVRRRILTSRVEFPGVAHAWLGARAAGWEVELIEVEAGGALDVGRVIEAIDSSTAVVSVPQVVYTNGGLLDVAAVARAAHEVGALVFVDAYQSAGTMPIDVGRSGVDLLATGTTKYLMGTTGIAFLYVSPRIGRRLRPTVTGWFGRVHPFEFDPATLDYAPGAARFDLGTPPVAPAFAARAGIDLIRRAGPDAIRRRVLECSRLAVDLARELDLRILGPADPSRRGAVTAIDAGSTDNAHRMEAELLERGMLVSARGRGVRLAAHGFTLDEEMEVAVRELAALLARVDS